MYNKDNQIMTTDAFSTTAGALTGLAIATGNNKAAAAIAGVAGVASLVRKISAGLTAGSEPPLGHIATEAGFASNGTDWRVKLSLPDSFAFKYSSIMWPLTQAGNALVFPFTPQITFGHSANYNTLDPVHNNYPFLSYENSKVESINITADFYCENSVDAAYWMAAVHFLRSVTKMAYGDSTDAGQPPPVIKLNGYGAYVFNNVPVVVKSFSMDLPKDVDYIGTPVDDGGDLEGAPLTYAPTKSTMSITLIPIYSRTQVRKFSLDSFANGDYVLGEQDTGYI
jgi:hypothetical protein